MFYLIKFKADYYCEGYESANYTMLVYALTFDSAIKRINDHSQKTKEFINPRDFVNLTII